MRVSRQLVSLGDFTAQYLLHYAQFCYSQCMTIIENTQRTDRNMVVADNIRAELSRQRWSGRKAATALGLTPTYVSRRLSGETPLDANDIYMFAEFLSAPVSKLFEQTAKGQPSD